MNEMTVIENNCRDLAASRARLRKLFEARQKAVNLATREFDDNIRIIQNNRSG